MTSQVNLVTQSYSANKLKYSLSCDEVLNFYALVNEIVLSKIKFFCILRKRFFERVGKACKLMKISKY